MSELRVLSAAYNAQVCLRMLSACMQAQRDWSSALEGVVVLDTGVIVATEPAWQNHMQTLCNLASEAMLHYPQLEWALADIVVIRQWLTDGDATRRELARRAALSIDAETLAKQALLDIVMDALAQGASDIHFRMAGLEARIAYRIHGQLVHQAARSRTSVTEAIAAALNTQSDDFHEVFDERKVTGASITLQLPDSGMPIRIRSQKSPCRDGFSVTLRLQVTPEHKSWSLRELGFPIYRARQLREMMGQATGLLLISGPTGHGKTTTLAALNGEVPLSRKVIALEDPIEIIQPHIEQKHVSSEGDPEAFAQMIRSVLREDPDIIEVSEIRDAVTAQAAISAAMTGHLVVSTVHATDAIGIIARLYDLGCSALQLSQPNLIAGLLAQRLLPVLCEHCKCSGSHSRWGKVFRQHSAGCSECGYTGIAGRMAISELVIPDEKAAHYIREQKLSTWYEELLQQGWDGMACEAALGIQQGHLDPEHAEQFIPNFHQPRQRRVPSHA